MQKRPESESDLKSLLYRIVSALIKNEVYYAGSENRMKIAEAVKYLHAHYLENDFRVAELSKIARVCPRCFEMLFHDEFKCTPKEYILALKMQLARELLRSEKYTVSDVAEQLGYGDVYHFSKIFKAKTGYTPSEYKRLGERKTE